MMAGATHNVTQLRLKDEFIKMRIDISNQVLVYCKCLLSSPT